MSATSIGFGKQYIIQVICDARQLLGAILHVREGLRVLFHVLCLRDQH